MRVGFYFVVAGLIVAGMFAMPLLCAELAAMDAENTADLHVEALDMDCVDLGDEFSALQNDLFMAQLTMLQAEVVPSLDIMIRD